MTNLSNYERVHLHIVRIDRSVFNLVLELTRTVWLINNSLIHQLTLKVSVPVALISLSVSFDAPLSVVVRPHVGGTSRVSELFVAASSPPAVGWGICGTRGTWSVK